MRSRFFFVFLILFCFSGLEAKISALAVNDPKYFWMDDQIEREFAPFFSGITREMLEMTQNRSSACLRYKVVDSKVFGPQTAVKEMLETLAELYPLPNVEFLYLQGDGIVKHKGKFDLDGFPGPLFLSAKPKDCSNAILFHDWYFSTKGILPLNWPILSQTVEQISLEIPWEAKISAAYWRGYPTGFQYDYSPQGWQNTPRGKACYLSFQFPNLIDAGFTAYDLPFISYARKRQKIEIYKPWTDQRQHMQYKYQLCMDGHTCTYPGLQWRLLSNCTVLLQETDNIMWFYCLLKPWVHYIPIEYDLSDLIEKILWAQNHDEECRRIAEEGQNLAREHLLADMTCLYCYKALLKYASLQRFAVSEN